MKRKILAAAVVALFAGAASAAIEWTRTETGAGPVGERPRKLAKTWIFAERQIYGPGVNVLHKWQDRPLFHDAGLREDRPEMSGFYRGFFRDVDILRASGLDGFGAISYHNVNERHLRLLESNPKPGYRQMPVICPSMGGVDFGEGVFEAPGFKAVYEREKRFLLASAASPCAPRVDGKAVVWTYGGNEDTILAWAKRMRADSDLPPFVLMAQMPFMDIYDGYGYVAATGRLESGQPRRIPAETVAAYREKVRELAALTGGLHLWCVNRRRDWDGEYPVVTEATPIYRDYIAPVLKEVAALPENRDLLVGAYLRQGYVNKFMGTTDGEYGTATLRAYLDEISSVNPDVLMGFEWNEENENTHFQPTVAHAKTWARILHCYRARLDREAPTPMPGDDVGVPNLVLSVRQALKLGEPYHLELLYLPDGAAEKEIFAQVLLQDEDGKTLVKFPTERIATDALKAIDYRLASEQLAGHLSVTPVLAVRSGGETRRFTGFGSTRLRPTRALDYLYTHVPLRDLLRPEAAAFEVSPTDEDGVYRVEARVAAAEELAQVEVLDGLEEVAAADAENWFDNEAFALFRVGVTVGVPELFGGEGDERGVASFENAPGGRLRGSGMMWETFGVYGPTAGGGTVVNMRISSGAGTCFVRVPRAELPKARFALKFPRLGEVGVDLAQVEALGRIDRDVGKSVTFRWERLDDLADIPRPLGTRTATLSRRVRSLNRFPQFQLRVVTKGGRVYRSGLRQPRRPSGARVPLDVFSETARRTERVLVWRDALPVYDYAFDPAHGSLVRSGWERSGDGTLGEGGNFGQPLSRAKVLGRLPADFAGSTAARWVREGDGWLMAFEKGEAFVLPQEVIPGAAEFALEFEFRPRTTDDQVILRSANSERADEGLQLLVKGGTLRLSYYGIHFYRPPDFDTKAKLVAGEWNAVRIVRRFDRFECEVNGVKTRFAWDRRARHFAGAVFGANVQPNDTCPKGMRAFAGELRRFTVSHVGADSAR